MTPEQEAELGRGIYDREKVHALISAFADSAVELGANFLEVAEAAQAVCAEAAARAPVETGRLRSSIHASAEGLTAAVRCDCPYGAAVELGTSRQSARPFMQPAADTERAELATRAARKCGE